MPCRGERSMTVTKAQERFEKRKESRGKEQEHLEKGGTGYRMAALGSVRHLVRSDLYTILALRRM